MHEWLYILSGGAGGAMVTAGIARWQIRRSLLLTREAERRARSAERLAELGAMTGGLAHEIKNPLSTIGLNAQLLAEAVDEFPSDRPVDPDDRQRLTRRITSLRREVERLRGILTDFLAYAGELRLDARVTDLNGVVQELADFFEPHAVGQGVRLRVDLGPGPLEANLDAALVKQAVLNLLLNAVQAMAAHAGQRELIVRTHGDRSKAGIQLVCLHVIDTGPGMSPQVRAKLFTPYFTTKAGGSGLGLATARRLIEAHEGRIDIYSEPGKGTDMCVCFPEVRSEVVIHK